MFRRPERLLLLVLLPGLVLAANGNQMDAAAGEPIIIRADRATLDREAGTGVYSGNAELVQGKRRLEADRIELHMVDGKLQQAEAFGHPVRIREGETLSGHARRVVYSVADREVHLYEEALIDHQGRTFEGARLHYELESRQVRASGSDEERVRMVIPQEQPSRPPTETDTEKDQP
jgi:lipopolysaccharide export system protein LptA